MKTTLDLDNSSPEEVQQFFIQTLSWIDDRQQEISELEEKLGIETHYKYCPGQLAYNAIETLSWKCRENLVPAEEIKAALKNNFRAVMSRIWELEDELEYQEAIS